MTDTLYTIGYAGYDPDALVAALTRCGVRALLDVRSDPHSRYYTAFDRESLMTLLPRRGIEYRFCGDSFGARPRERALYRQPEGYLDFEKVAADPGFQQALAGVRAELEGGSGPLCLLCAEKRPIDCHRAILVARAFRDGGVPVRHLSPDGVLEQEDIDAALLDKFFPQRDQFSLFGGGGDDAALLAEAYRRQNAAIGHQIGDA